MRIRMTDIDLHNVASRIDWSWLSSPLTMLGSHSWGVSTSGFLCSNEIDISKLQVISRDATSFRFCAIFFTIWSENHFDMCMADRETGR